MSYRENILCLKNGIKIGTENIEKEGENRLKVKERRRNRGMTGESMRREWMDQKPARVKFQGMIKCNITMAIKRD